jgi:hypothetical protein
MLIILGQLRQLRKAPAESGRRGTAIASEITVFTPQCQAGAINGPAMRGRSGGGD